MASKAQDEKLKDMLGSAMDGIETHNGTIKELIADQGEKPAKEHCKGMEGLVEEAKAHVLDEAPEDKALRDVLIIAQYQRMSHYGIAGFGTAAAFARALGLEEHAGKQEEITGEIYASDEFGTMLAEQSVNLKALDA